MNRDLERLVDTTVGTCVEQMLEQLLENLHEDLMFLEPGVDDVDMDVAEVTETLMKMINSNLEDNRDRIEGSLQLMLDL